MTRNRCPICRAPWSNAAAHAETPELAGPGDLTVWYCYASETHVPVRLGWLEDARRSARSLLRSLRVPRERA